jgi:hypothetical protein
MHYLTGLCIACGTTGCTMCTVPPPPSHFCCTPGKGVLACALVGPPAAVAAACPPRLAPVRPGRPPAPAPPSPAPLLHRCRWVPPVPPFIVFLHTITSEVYFLTLRVYLYPFVSLTAVPCLCQAVSPVPIKALLLLSLSGFNHCVLASRRLAGAARLLLCRSSCCFAVPYLLLSISIVIIICIRCLSEIRAA